MTFDPNVPNASQSPGLFPAQNNTNNARLKTIINSDHVFNDTAQSTDGVHRQCTFISRAIPVVLPAGTNSILYSWVDANSQSQLRFYNGLNDFQITPEDTVLTGTVTVAAGYTNIVLLPAEVFGEIFLWKGRFIQAGTFVSDAAVTNGYSYVQGIGITGPSPILSLGFDGAGASGLNLTVTGRASSYGVWNYRIFYRSKT